MREYMKSAIEFSKMLDVKKSTYSQWENEISIPPMEKAFEIARKLNKRIDEIWYEE